MRCKLCGEILKPAEIIYYLKQKRHEDWCKKCRDKYFEEYSPQEELHIEEPSNEQDN